MAGDGKINRSSSSSPPSPSGSGPLGHSPDVPAGSHRLGHEVEPHPSLPHPSLHDTFERKPGELGQGVTRQIGGQLQAVLEGKTPLGKTQFTNQDLEYLVATFAAVLKQDTTADRFKRAKLFAQAILKRPRWRALFDRVSEDEQESMFVAIAEMLESSAFFGKLVDEVTDEINHLNRR